jgi:alpha-mannosidase
VRLGLEQDQPLLVLPARGELPTEPLFSMRGEQGYASVQVTAFKPSDDGQAWIIRLLETGGTDQRITLNWRNKARPATWLSDNSELPRTAVEGAVPIPARSVVTLRVACQAP